MQEKCPICGTSFEAEELRNHLAEAHSGSYNPETQAVHAVKGHKCVFCGAVLATPEELKAHNASQHRR